MGKPVDHIAPPGDAARSEDQRPIRTAVVGMSVGQTCGVHDYAVLLADALNRERVSCSLHWLWRTEESIGASRSEVTAWTRELALELEQSRPDAILLHYSVFAYAHRGLPLFVHPTLSALRRSGAPIVTIAHEFAYPWLRRGWRGKSWAVSQRMLLVDVMRASTAVVVTIEGRVEWLASRRWLPRRPVLVVPVFSTLPAPTAKSAPDADTSVIGLFGYSSEGAAVSLVLDAVRLLADRGVHVQLRLLGGPGRSSSAGAAWLAGAGPREVGDALSFTGILPAQELSDALASCDVLLFADTAGPTARKTTLAGSLASGRPVIAIDGPLGWAEFIESGAARVVAPTSRALAEAIGALVADRGSREALGALGREFAEERMGVARTAKTVAGILGGLVPARLS